MIVPHSALGYVSFIILNALPYPLKIKIKILLI